MDNLELEQYITCPITGLIFSDPVKADDGHTYERSAIKEWLQKNDTSPLTTIKIGKNIIPDFSINSLVQQFIQKNPKRKKNQFQSEIEYVEAIDEVKNIFKNKNYNDLLLYKNFDLNDHINEDETMSELISKIPDINVFKHVLESAINRFNADYNGKYLVHYVVKYSPLSFIQYLHIQGYKFDVMTRHKKTPLHIAAGRINDHSDEIFNFLANIGGDAIRYAKAGNNSYGDFTVLYYAIKNNKTSLVYKLWNNEEEYDYDQFRPIHLLAYYMPEEVLHKLRKNPKSEEFNPLDKKGDNFLHYLFANADPKIIIDTIKILVLKTNKNLWKKMEHKGRLDKTPTSILIENFFDNFEVWDFLLKNRVNLRNKQADGLDLGIFIHKTSNDKTLDYILSYIKHENCQDLEDNNGLRPIHYFLTNKKPDWIILKYIDMVGFYNFKTNNNDNILHYVIRWKPDLLDHFLKHCNNVDDISTPNNQNVYPIHEAAKKGLSYVISLINKGALYNVADQDGKTVLWYLIQYKEYEVVSFLKLYPDADYKNGRSLIHDAINNYDLVFYLISIGTNTQFDGPENLIFKLLHLTHEEPYENIKKLFELIGANGLDCDLPIIINPRSTYKKTYTVKERLDFFGLSNN